MTLGDLLRELFEDSAKTGFDPGDLLWDSDSSDIPMRDWTIEDD